VLNSSSTSATCTHVDGGGKDGTWEMEKVENWHRSSARTEGRGGKEENWEIRKSRN